MMKRWRTLSIWQRALLGVPIGTSFGVAVVSLFRAYLSSATVISVLIGALVVTIAAAWLRAEDPSLNPQRFAGKWRYDDSTGHARLVPMQSAVTRKDA